MYIYGYEHRFIIIEKNEEYDIVYSTYSNKVSAIGKEESNLFQDVIQIAKDNKGCIKNIYSLYDKELVDELLEVLFANALLFETKEACEKADYAIQYKKLNFFHAHKAYLHLTQRCNLNCQYCYNARNIGKTKDLPTELWKAIIYKLKENKFDYIVFTGGEVFLRNDILELVDTVKECDMRLHILTNGTFKITKEIIEKADAIEVSLDAIDVQVNEETRRNSTYYKTYENLLNIPFELRRKVIIKTVLTKSNELYIEEMKRKLKSEGFKSVEIMPQQPNTMEEIKQLSNVILKRETHPFESGMVAKCNGCYEVIAINADGKIYPCQAFIKKGFELGDVFADNWLKDIENNELTKIFMHDNVLNSECKECDFKYICGGPCKAVSYNLTQNLKKGRQYYCERAKKECLEYLSSIDFGE